MLREHLTMDFKFKVVLVILQTVEVISKLLLRCHRVAGVCIGMFAARWARTIVHSTFMPFLLPFVLFALMPSVLLLISFTILSLMSCLLNLLVSLLAIKFLLKLEIHCIHKEMRVTFRNTKKILCVCKGSRVCKCCVCKV